MEGALGTVGQSTKLGIATAGGFDQPSEPAGSQSTARLHLDLIQDLRPVGAAEHLLVAEVARQAVALDDSSAAVATMRRAASNLLMGWSAPMEPGLRLADIAAAGSAPVDRVLRTNLAHHRAFSRALQLLLQLQSRRMANVRSPRSQFSDAYPSESACLNYLLEWRRRNFACRNCGHNRAHFIASRLSLECAECRAQTGLRTGTVLNDSALPIATWFAAIRTLLDNQSIPTTQLQRLLQLRRAATVRAMATKIRAALTAADHSMLLAGLDQEFDLPESSAPSAEIFENQPTWPALGQGVPEVARNVQLPPRSLAN